MDNFNDTVSSIILGGFLLGLIIPLVMFLRKSKRENEELENSKR